MTLPARLLPSPLTLGLLAGTALCAPAWVTAASAAQIEATGRVSHVILYPQGAQVTRRLDLTAPPGSHEVILPGLPEGIDPDSLRIAAEGARIGSVSLQQGRALPDESPDSPAILSAREELRARERALRERDARTAAIRAEAQAAEDTVAFLMKLAEAEGAAGGDVAALAQSVQAQILEARKKAIWAEDAARQSEEGRDEDVKAVEAARARLEALENPATQGEALVMAVAVEAAGAEQGTPQAFAIEITSATDMAGWRPVYDLRLDRKAGTLAIERGVVVSQNTGEDWQDATLRLSTARPGGQAAATEVPSDFPRAEQDYPAATESAVLNRQADAAYGAAVAEAAPVVVDSMQATDLGLSIAYDYPAPVTIRDGVDALRLKLDEKSLTPEIFAEAAPRFDATAYLMAEGPNAIGEPILPGRASLYADGVMVGQTDLPLIAAGDELRLGFGPIDGILAERRVPERQEGTGGLIRRKNEDDETATLRIENLTGDLWPLRVVDRVPVSQQEILTVDWSADPQPSETEPDGRRGVLVWETELKPAEIKEITVTTRMRWPDDHILIR